jgi:hypothetical protein
MTNWAQKLEASCEQKLQEKTILSISDIADDTVQALALTCMFALLVTAAVLLVI